MQVMFLKLIVLCSTVCIIGGIHLVYANVSEMLGP